MALSVMRKKIPVKNLFFALFKLPQWDFKSEESMQIDTFAKFFFIPYAL